MINRKQALMNVIAYNGPIDTIAKELNKYDWDYDEEEPLAIIHKRDVISVLMRYMSGEISPDSLHSWGAALEARTDTGYEPGFEDIIVESIEAIADYNPDLSGPLSPEIVFELLHNLQ